MVQVKICVHSGRFHADDVLGVALAALELGVVPDVVRTRDPAEFAATTAGSSKTSS